METIDERADVYCQENAYQGGYDIEDVRSAYLVWAEDEHKELTKWNDPNDPPENARTVLVKYLVRGESTPYYTTGFYLRGGHAMPTGWMTAVTVLSCVIGWREIHEN